MGLTGPQEAALALADAFLALPSPPPADLAERVGRHLTAEQVAEVGLALAVFQGFVRVIISLGFEPVPGTMPVQVMPKP